MKTCATKATACQDALRTRLVNIELVRAVFNKSAPYRSIVEFEHYLRRVDSNVCSEYGASVTMLSADSMNLHALQCGVYFLRTLLLLVLLLLFNQYPFSWLLVAVPSREE